MAFVKDAKQPFLLKVAYVCWLKDALFPTMLDGPHIHGALLGDYLVTMGVHINPWTAM